MSRSECENDPSLLVSCMFWCLKKRIPGITWSLNGGQPPKLMFSWRNASICQFWKEENGYVRPSERQCVSVLGSMGNLGGGFKSYERYV